MFATTTTGHREHVAVTKDIKVLQSMNINNEYCRLIQTTTITTETWVGLNYADASSVCVASETSTLGTTTRNYLGGARISVSAGGTTIWATIEGCWGTKISSQLSRMGDTNAYQVTKTTQVFNVTNNGGSLTLL